MRSDNGSFSNDFARFGNGFL
ncbi:MAG: LCI fold-containing protein [Cyanobacteriota bacterium]